MYIYIFCSNGGRLGGTNNTAKQKQNEVTAYLKNMWLLLFASTEYISCIGR